MKLKLNSRMNAAYIYLTEQPMEYGSVTKTYPCDPIEVGGQINLDFDSTGRLVGIEVLDPMRLLPPDLLRKAEISGKDKKD